MTTRNDETGLGTARVLDGDEVEGVLSGAFYNPAPQAPVSESKLKAEKPTHYKVICISMYTKDLERRRDLLSGLGEDLRGEGLQRCDA